MRGVKNLILGLIFLAVAGGLMAGVDLGRGVVQWGVWGLVVMGVVVFAGGAYQAIGPGSRGADAEQAYKASSNARLLMQSMLATALADGPLDDKEAGIIADACELIVHEPLDRESIRRLAPVIEEKGNAILEEIHYEGQMLNLDARKAVVDACILILTATDNIDVRETLIVNTIAQKLGFSDLEAQAMIAEAVAAAKKG